MTRLVSVALDRPLWNPYTYIVPDAFSGLVDAGTRVSVPLGPGRARGVVIGDAPEVSGGRAIKPILGVLDPHRLISPNLLALAHWMSEHYVCPLGLVLDAMVPPPMGAERPDPLYRCSPRPNPQPPGTAVRVRRGIGAQVLERLDHAPAGMRRSQLLEELPRAGAALRALLADGAIVEDRSAPSAVETGAWEAVFPALTPAQDAVAGAIAPSLEGAAPHVHLLQGITGSGKTEIYLHLMHRCLSMGRSALMLLPEIALTVPMVRTLRERFGPGVAVLHSALAPRERAREWAALARGERHVAVGARSAIFAPVVGLGLVVIDEEAETSYKQSERPHYHARDVAIERARLEGACIVLGSATPSLESWHLARAGAYGHHRLLERFNRQPLPEVRMIDTREEYQKYRNRSVLSIALKDAVGRTLESGGQVLLFINRRGHSTHVHCPACGFVLGCDDCAVALTYHQSGEDCQCHVCGRRMPPPRTCPQCGDEAIRYRGAGTQKVEEEFAANFPGVSAVRMDSDTTARAGAHARIVNAVEGGQARVLIGTQMVAKGFDFKGLDLVGVVDADSVLHLPDFRSAERTFQLVTQVAGRVGRGDRPGLVLVQTHAPRHYALTAAQRHDFESFAARELPDRQALFYPPFSRLIQVLAQAAEEEAARAALVALRGALEVAGAVPAPIRVLGPAPARLARAHGLFREQILFKVPLDTAASAPLRAALRAHKPPRGVAIQVDADPVL